MLVKRLAALGLLFTLATCSAFACTKTPPPAPAPTFDAAAGDQAPAASSATPAGAVCVVDTDKMKAAMAAVGGSGTGLAQDATVQQIIKLYGASIPQGGSGTGLCQDASLQALYLLIAAQLDAGSGGGGVTQLDGDIIGPSNANTAVRVQNQPVAAGTSSGQVWIFNGTNWVPGFASIDAGSLQLAGDVNGAANNNAVWSISGDGGATLPITPSTLLWPTDAAAPTLTQSQALDGGTPVGIAFNPQQVNGGSGTAAQNTPGGVTVTVGAPGAVGTPGNENGIVFIRVGTALIALQAQVGTPAAGVIYFGSNAVAGTRSSTNWSIGASGSTTNINASSVVAFDIAGTNYGNMTTTYDQIRAPVGGLTGVSAFSWLSASVALTSGASNVLTNAQYFNPHLKFTGALTGAGTTVTFPSTDGACWDLDFSAVTTITDSITLIANGKNWGTPVAAVGSSFPHVCYSAGYAGLVGVLMTE